MRRSRPNLPWTGALYVMTAAMAIVPGVELLIGPAKWHTPPSWGAARYAALWDTYGVVLLAVGVLVALGVRWHWARLGGFYAGFAVYGYFAIGSWAALLGGERVNALTPPNFTILATLYLVSLRWAVHHTVNEVKR